MNEMIPHMRPHEFDRLVRSIRRLGLFDPITLAADGRIIDGKERYRACLEAGVEPRFTTLPEDADLAAYTMAMNVYRQSFTEDQRAAIAVQWESLGYAIPDTF